MKKYLITICVILSTVILLNGCNIEVNDGDSKVKITEEGLQVEDKEGTVAISKDSIKVDSNKNKKKPKDLEEEEIIEGSLLINASENKEEEKIEKKLNCEDEYQKIADEHFEKYNDCGIGIKTSTCGDPADNDNTAKSQKQTNMIIIFDASGSMAVRIEGKTRMEIAKKAAKIYINNLQQKNINIGLIVYGHKGSNQARDKQISCEGIEEIYPLGKVNFTTFNDALDRFKPTGYTPIAASLEKAKKVLSKYDSKKYNNTILIISDGEETCGGDPIAKAKELNSSNIGVIINVIGLDVDKAVETQLQNIAQSGGGEYYSVKAEEEIANAMKKHEEYMRQHECDLNQHLTSVDNKLSADDAAFECSHRLRMEKHAVEVDLRTSFSGPRFECKEYIAKKYDKRHRDVKNKIDKIDNQNKKNIMDADEDYSSLIDDDFDMNDLDEDIGIDLSDDF
jgi:Mg-chelatase subunit ChlD